MSITDDDRPGSRRSANVVVSLLAFAVFAFAALAPLPGVAEDWVIVVHRSRADSPNLAQIAQIYLKKRRYWRDGSTIVPVNREAGSTARSSFSRAVLRSDVEHHGAYWNRQYFQGILPPITLASSEAVLRFVAEDTRAVGYVPASLADVRVRVVARYEGAPEVQPSGESSQHSADAEPRGVPRRLPEPAGPSGGIE